MKKCNELTPKEKDFIIDNLKWSADVLFSLRQFTKSKESNRIRRKLLKLWTT